VDITAVVTVTDDGGSSGRLRREFDILPPGDIRNCMVALSRDETFMARLFQYRFASGRGLKGHSFGNLFLTAMADLTGDFRRAVQYSTQVLEVLGRIYPATNANVVLEATLVNGKKVAGETRISRSRSRIEKIALKPRRARPLQETLDAIANADLITLGPGSLFTSVIPNLLVEGIPEALAASPALKVYFVNLMSQPGETTAFRASDHVAALLRHCGRHSGLGKSRGVLDAVVVNQAPIPMKILGLYEAKAAQQVVPDHETLRKLVPEVLEADLVGKLPDLAGQKIRHDPSALATIALGLARRGRQRRYCAKQAAG